MEGAVIVEIPLPLLERGALLLLLLLPRGDNADNKAAVGLDDLVLGVRMSNAEIEVEEEPVVSLRDRLRSVRNECSLSSLSLSFSLSLSLSLSFSLSKSFGSER